jgi:hypothetical protein
VIIIQRRRLLYPAYVQDYLDRVTAADVAAGDSSGLEVGVTDAVSAFMQDLVSISYLGVSANVISQAASVIKAMPIMAGARTRAGARVPVVGPTPTEFGTAGGWNYNRKTGLQANGTDNYFNSNRNNNADPQNSQHMSVYVTSAGTFGRSYIGAGAASTGATQIGTLSTAPNNLTFRSRSSSESGQLANTSQFIGCSRSISTQVSLRAGGSTTTVSNNSQAPFNGNILVFARADGSNVAGSFTNARLFHYSIGENLDLGLLDTRVATLISAFAAAIP